MKGRLLTFQKDRVVFIYRLLLHPQAVESAAMFQSESAIKDRGNKGVLIDHDLEKETSWVIEAAAQWTIKADPFYLAKKIRQNATTRNVFNTPPHRKQVDMLVVLYGG